MSKFIEDLTEALAKNGAKVVKDGESSYIDFGKGVTADIRSGTKIAKPNTSFLESMSEAINEDSKGFFKDVEKNSGRISEQADIAEGKTAAEVQAESAADVTKTTAAGSSAELEAKNTANSIFGNGTAVTAFAGIGAVFVTTDIAIGYKCTNNVTVDIEDIDEDVITYKYTPVGLCKAGTFRPRVNDVVTFSFSGTTLYKITAIDKDQVTVDGPEITATTGQMTVLTTLSHQATGTVGDITNYVVSAAESILSGGASILKWILIGLAVVIILFMIIFVVIKKFV